MCQEEGLLVEEYAFWSLAHSLIKVENYRILYFSKEQNELWLENPDSKQAPILRLVNTNLDWSRWIERDIQLTGMNGEKIRKQMVRKNIHIENIYISPFPPVDDYNHLINTQKQFDQTYIQTYIMTKETYRDIIEKLQTNFQNEMTVPLFEEQDLTSELLDVLKKQTLEISVNRVKAEQSIFTFGKPFFTYVFIVIQLIMFLLLELKGGSKDSATLVAFGAKDNPLILQGEWWRFIIPIFLHIGFLHLVMNTLGLYYLGTAVEKIYGSLRFFWIYLFAGIIGFITSFVFSPYLSAGASGAIYGCFGALLYVGLIYPKLFSRTLGTNVITILVLNIVISFTFPSIDIAGHLGGLVGGFVATGVVHFPKKKKYTSQLMFLILSALLAIALLFYGYNKPEHLQRENAVLQLAQNYVKEENYEQAYSLLSEHLKESSEPSEYLYFQLSYVEIEKGMLEEAEVHLLHAIEINPNFHEAHFNLAIIFLQQQEVEKAEEHVKKAIKLDPSNETYQEVLDKIE
jgi:rhomboid protease GluP